MENTENCKLYSAKVIAGATFIGGPLAGGYMIGENFKALGRLSEGRTSLIIGIVSTLIIFVGLFMVPENILDKMPKHLIPLIYTGIVWGIVEWKQGEVLKSHKEQGNTFYSSWRAAGIGFISLILISVGILGYVFLETNSKVYVNYENEMKVFSKNEKESLVFYDHLDTETNYSLIKELENKTIPKWKENIEIVNRINEFQDLPYYLKQKKEVLMKYSELRLNAFELYKKSFEEDTDKYALEIERIHKEIEEEIDKL
jgi:hypothetical protein